MLQCLASRKEVAMPDVLVVQGTDIRNISKGTEQFICLTDIANRFGSSDLINDWLKNKNTLEFCEAVGLTGSWHRNFCYGRTLRGNLRA